MEDSDSEYEVEESVVLVELNGIIDANFLLQEQSPTKVLGIDSDNPILQIGHYIFSGEYEHTTGTVVVYQPTDSSNEKDFEYVCKTDTKLVMKRIFIKEKSNDTQETSEEVPSTLTSINGNEAASEIPEKQQPTELSTEESTTQVSSNIAEAELQDKQILDPSSSSAGSKKEPKKKSQSKQNASKGLESYNTFIPEDKNTKTKGQKRKRGLTQKDNQSDTVEINLIKNKKKDSESEPSSKKKLTKDKTEESLIPQKEDSRKEKEESEPYLHQESKPETEPTQMADPQGQPQEVDKNNIQIDNESNLIKISEPELAENVNDSETSSLNESVETAMHVEEGIVMDEQCTNNPAINVEEGIVRDEQCINNPAINEEISHSYPEESSMFAESNSESVQTSTGPSGNITMTATLNEESITSHPVAEESILLNDMAEVEQNQNSETVNQLVESSTDKSLLSNLHESPDEVRGDGNCSSSGDMVYLGNTDTSLDVCQSSDSPNVSEDFQEPIEQFEDNGASSSTSQQHRSNTAQEDILDESMSGDDGSYSRFSQTETTKPSCEVSQSLDDENQSSVTYSEVKDSNECEIILECQDSSDIDIENVEEEPINAMEAGASSDAQVDVDGNEITKRKLSSCEVTQSNSSERELPVPPEDASECEVFSQSVLPDVENVFDPSPAESVDPFELVAESSDEVGCSRPSLASESSMSEVSQSHRSVIQEPRTVIETNLLGLPFPDGAVCSQSTDQVSEHQGETGSDSKDLCVSSCDVAKEHVHGEPILSDENSRNRGCEVSQSDKTDANTSENSEQERLPTNECDAIGHDLPGRHGSSSESGIGMLNVPIEESSTSSQRQMACEVSQSSNSANNASGSDSNLQGLSGRSPNEDSNNKCVSSDDIVHILSSHEDDEEEENTDPACEVSQSFRAENLALHGEPCRTTAFASDEASNVDSKVQEHRNSCEVTQSLELESSSASDMYQDEDDSLNECERSNSNLDGSDQSDSNAVNQSNDLEEICESSDDIIIISNDESNSQSEESRPVNSSGCEVSQSFRLGDGNIIPPAEQMFNLGVESSDECEVYPSSVGSAVEYDINPSISDNKSICESSDDIEKSAGEYSSRISKSDSQGACQSTDFSEDPSNVECTGNSSSELNEGNEASDSNDSEINVCESSEDINVNMSSSQLISGPSTISSLSESGQYQISQSETQTTPPMISSNVSQSDSVQVSSSNDVGSNITDAIYSSSNVSHCTVSSNSEVSQSYVRKRPYVWSGNLQFDASSSNSSVGVVADASYEQPFSTALSSEASAQSAANEPVLETESNNSGLPSGSSSLVESSISSSSTGRNQVKKPSKDTTTSPQNLSKSKSAAVAKEQHRESVILSGSSTISDMPDNSSLQNQSQAESMPQGFPFQLDNMPQLGRASADSDPRPSLLEVMVSSASDFRNSLLFESTNFSMEANPNISQSPVGNSDFSKVSRSTERDMHSEEEYSSNQEQVSRSSDIGNTVSYANQSSLPSEISESAQPDLVQSSSQVHGGLRSLAKDTSADSESKSSSTSDNLKIIESPQSSIFKVSESSNSSNKSSSSDNFAQPMDLSSQLNTLHQPKNVEDEISSTPSHIPSSNPQVLTLDDGGQCSFIEGNLVILQEPNTISGRNFMQFPEGQQILLQVSNEAEILNRNIILSSSQIQMPLQEEMATDVSTPPINEGGMVASGDDHSSEVSESLASDPNNLSHSVLTDDNVSCSVVQFSLANETFGKKYSFNEGEFSGVSREAESKVEEGMSSYQSVCDDNILTVPNLSSSANAELSMYSHIGEFEDSIQSSSLDATHFSISERIKAISSPPTFSNSESSEDPVPTSISPFATFSSEPQNLPSLQYSLPSISNISSSFISEGIPSRLGSEGILEDRSILMGGAATDIESRCTVVRSPNSGYIPEHASGMEDQVSESGSRIDVEETSQMSGVGNEGNSPEEFEVLSEYEEIENAADDSNMADSSND